MGVQPQVFAPPAACAVGLRLCRVQRPIHTHWVANTHLADENLSQAGGDVTGAESAPEDTAPSNSSGNNDADTGAGVSHDRMMVAKLAR